MYKNGKEQMHTFNSIAFDEIFLGYSAVSKVFKVFNRRTLVIEESPHVVFDESTKRIKIADSITQADEVIEKLEKLCLYNNN